MDSKKTSDTRNVTPEREPYFRVTRDERNIKQPRPQRPYGASIENIENAAKRDELSQDALRKQFEQMVVGSTSQPSGQSSSGRGGGYGGHSRHGSQAGGGK